MNPLRRELAPIGARAWDRLEEEARRILHANLSARRFVDIDGPHGWTLSSVGLGRAEPAKLASDVAHRVRRVQPLTELRTNFSLDREVIEELARGAGDVDLGSLRSAARRAAEAEETLIYDGYAPAHVRGLREATTYDAMNVESAGSAWVDASARALMHLIEAGVEGPYLLVVGSGSFELLATETSAYPAREQIAKLLGQPPAYAPHLQGGYLVSTRGGDFVLTLGQDWSIGFEAATADKVELFLLASSTFRVLGEEAAVAIRASQ
jgi:uncharacterized linocin/CFP29 family protein